MIERLNPEVAILNEALELPIEQRAAFVEKACAGDPALRTQVEALLQAHQQAEGFLEASPALGSRRMLPRTEGPGEKIGHYKLLQQIGEGGGGVVYMADQEQPVRRRVALKIIRPGMDTKAIITRFEAERQALALMEHPNIARVLDAGATETGRPFFVMELVRGIKITDYCDQNNLSTRERLDLFVQICRAIQHAHQKGIIHRDIKPSNILVTVNDGVAVPKVIDFGIAKATQGRLTDKTLFTGFEQFIGTPAYTSPEQAIMTSVDIDTRSDIYSLGVLLYELLTGRTPFEAKELLATGLDEMRRKIREDEPLRPSRRLTSLLGDELTRTAKARQTEAPQLIHLVRGDLDCIVMKCLEKDRSRRYETANGLAHDIQRHLNHEPVNARPPSALYRARKGIRRNKTAFAAGTAIAVVLIFGLIASISQAVRAKRAEREQAGLREKAQSANRELRDTVSLLELERAEDFLRGGDPGLGVAHLAAILRHDPSNHIAATRLVSALVHRNWALRTPAAMRHVNRIETIAFSPDGLRVLSASRDSTAKIWETATGELVATLQHGLRVNCAHYSPDGTRIVTASADGTARIWDATNGAALTPPLTHQGEVHWADFSSDGTMVLSAAADRMVRVWETGTGALLRNLGPQRSPVARACFRPDGKEIATGSKGGSVRIWDVASGHQVALFTVHEAAITALMYSPDGRRLVSASEEGRVRLWSVARREAVPNALDLAEPIDNAIFSPDGRLLLTCSHDSAAHLWDGITGLPAGDALTHGGRVVAGAFSADGQKVLTISKEHSARVWDVRTRQPLCPPFREPDEFSAVAFSPNAHRIATASLNGGIRVWDVQPRRYSGHERPIQTEANSVSFSRDADAVVAACRDGSARVFDVRVAIGIGAERRHSSLRHEAELNWAEFSSDGKRILTGASNAMVRLWDWPTRRVIAGPFQYPSRIRSARFSPNGERVVTAAVDGTVRVWDVQTGEPITPVLTHGGEAVGMAIFSPDGELIASAGEDHTARLWNAQSGESMAKPLKHVDHVKWAEFSPDGARIVTASSDNTARIWDVRTGAQLAPPLQHARIVDKAAFSPDGRRVITASMDRTARIWDAASGEALTPPLKHDYSLFFVAFSLDGEQAVTGCWNGVARLWDSRTGQPLTEPLGITDWNWRHVSFDPRTQRIATAGRDAILRLWQVPSVSLPVPDWFPDFAEAVGGIRLGSRGHVEPVKRGEFEGIVQSLSNAKTPADTYQRVARWYLADPARRPALSF